MLRSLIPDMLNTNLEEYITVNGIYKLSDGCFINVSNNIDDKKYDDIKNFLIKHNKKMIEITLKYNKTCDKPTIIKKGFLNIDDITKLNVTDDMSTQPDRLYYDTNYTIQIDNDSIIIGDILASSSVNIKVFKQGVDAQNVTGGKRKSNKSKKNKTKKSKKNGKRKTAKK